MCRLEERLRVRLLNRTTRKVGLTEIGRAYYERSSQILVDLDEADRMAGALDATPRGLLKLYVGSHITHFIAPVISDYLARYSATSVEVTAGEAMVDLVGGGFDLAVRAVPPPDSSLTVKKLTPWTHVLCCAPSYLEAHPEPRRPADLAHHNCLRYAFHPYGDEWRFEGPDGASGVKVSGKVTTNGAELLRSLALDGDGIFLGPSFMVADDIRSGALVRLISDYRPVEFAINAIYPHNHILSTKVRRFIDLLSERFAAHRAWMSELQA